MTITLKYVKGAEPQDTEVGWKYLLLCYKDVVLKRWEKGLIETWTAIYWWALRVEPLLSTYVKHWFDVNKTVYVPYRDIMTKVLISAHWIINEDVVVKQWTPLCEIWWLWEPVIMQQVNEDLYTKYKE